MLTCYHPLTGPALLTLLALLCAALLIQVPLLRRTGKARPHNLALYLGGSLGLVALGGALVLWLGSYAYSPLSFARTPALKAFVVQKQGGVPFSVVPGEGFSMSVGSVVSITAVTEPAANICYWTSATGASLDIGSSCDISYAPTPAEVDVLRVSVHPTCGVPIAAGQIKIAVFP